MRTLLTSSVRRCTAWGEARPAPLFSLFPLDFFQKGRGEAPKYLQGNNLQPFGKEISHFYLNFSGRNA
jgi:hypothetical protein